jgi:hypothetical protein
VYKNIDKNGIPLYISTLNRWNGVTPNLKKILKINMEMDNFWKNPNTRELSSDVTFKYCTIYQSLVP